jgi:hypothetical protein
MPPADSNLSSDDKTAIVCLYCGKTQHVGRSAMTITCKHCSKSLQLEDLPFKGYTSRRVIETLGIITIEKKGNVIVTERIQCGGLIVRGKLKGAEIISRGPVRVSPEAEIKGNITAPSLAVGAGAVLEGRYAIGQPMNGNAGHGKEVEKKLDRDTGVPPVREVRKK